MSALAVSLRLWAAGRAPTLARGLRLVDRVRARALLLGCEVGRDVMVQGALLVAVAGRARIGAGTCFIEGPVPSSLRVAPGGLLELGAGCTLNYGVSLEVHDAVHIGARCLFGSYVRVADGARGGNARVLIGDDVWLAHGAVIEPGVTIGDGAVIGAGAVVTRDVPAGMLALGNPARVMSQGLSSGGRS
jgi:maltose O-acetyltransferase